MTDIGIAREGMPGQQAGPDCLGISLVPGDQEDRRKTKCIP